jgi:glycopeptide antibiotics resistance protein
MKQGVIAEYDFNRRDALLAINRSGPLPDLVIARSFQPIHRTMLQLPWERHWRLLSDAEDIFINIAGFIPFGFLFSYLLRGSSSLSAMVFATVAAGAAISLAIEVTQAYLPTRNSSATDLVCNICGAIIGAIVLIKTRFVPEQ